MEKKFISDSEKCLDGQLEDSKNEESIKKMYNDEKNQQGSSCDAEKDSQSKDIINIATQDHIYKNSSNFLKRITDSFVNKKTTSINLSSSLQNSEPSADILKDKPNILLKYNEKEGNYILELD